MNGYISSGSGGGGSKKNYTLTWMNLNWNPADSTTYYFCPGQDLTPSTGSNGNRRHKMPVAATNFTLNVGLAANGSTEGATWTIRNITQATTANFSPSHSFTASGQANAYTGTGTLSCNANDYISVTLTTPAWATNPTSVRLFIILTFQAD